MLSVLVKYPVHSFTIEEDSSVIDVDMRFEQRIFEACWRLT